MNKFILPILAVAASLSIASAASAAVVEFVPPSDTTGHVWSNGSNDGYSSSRGVVFAPTSDFALTSVGLFEDLTGITLSYTLSLAPSSSGYVGGGTVLASGSKTVTTSGLEWIDFSLPTLNLTAGAFYHLAFSFSGNGSQNFFFDQSGAEPYSQAGFSGIDGTQGNDTGNYVIPDIRLNGSLGVPEPATWAMMIVGFGAVGLTLRGARRQVAA